MTPRTTTRLLRIATFAACLVPLASLVADALTGGLGANPIEAGMNRLGWWTLFFLTAALVPTPLHELLGWKWPVRLRRMLGLFAFAYATTHFCWYVGLDKFFDVHDIAADVAKRRFQAVGFVAYLTLWPLALTSTAAAVRRLGFPRWKRIHRLAYVAAMLGVIHFVWRVKADLREPGLFAVALATLLLARVAIWSSRRRAGARRALPAP
ncbi:MAG TPA: protein-methionine-sulfoxide reductase heme-binding subunit MsrQ [Anaeromyxobacteraceae bacterium]|nr:protein-methionine-sulfoxide reductase heme-binding subunit MsrQ [Anaeromyxobacteraceae bacterium]